jgi:DNA-binding response OmpR family regulator
MAKKVLIADDSAVIVQMMKNALTAEGFEVITASDGEEVLLKAENNPPDLFILDIMMPKLDGYTLNRKLKENDLTKDIPVIISTGKGQMREVFRMDEKSKIEGYLEKPFPLSVLVETVKKVFTK